MSRRSTHSFDIRSLNLRDSSLSPLLRINFGDNVKTLYGKVRTRMRRDKRRDIQISAPFDFRHESSTLPGMSQTELTLLREKSAASRVGLDDAPRPVSMLAIPPSFLFPGPESGGTELGAEAGVRSSVA